MDVTTAIRWRKSSRSSGNGGACVEVAAAATVLVRDSKDPGGPRLVFDRKAWETFAATVKGQPC
jgi:Domain of unknown function (DUF397)